MFTSLHYIPNPSFVNEMNHVILRMIALLAALSVCSCSSRRFRQVSSAMKPAIEAGEIVKVDFLAFVTQSPERWDVVAFEGPLVEKSMWISRIVGLPGEVIQLDSKGLHINGKFVSPPPRVKIDSYKPPSDKITPPRLPMPKFPYTVPADSYFVMGDNVDNSLDSRYWGALKSPKIVGKVTGK
jgi:signal peptidase I